MKATALLDQIYNVLRDSGFKLDAEKTDVAWIFAGEWPRAASQKKAEEWRLNWQPPDAGSPRIVRSFDIKAKPVCWLGFFIGCRFNWQAHVKHRLALGHYRIKAVES